MNIFHAYGLVLFVFMALLAVNLDPSDLQRGLWVATFFLGIVLIVSGHQARRPL